MTKKLEMNGSYLYTLENIDSNVTKESAGNYALGYRDDKQIFRVQYVGRSDSDVATELKTYLSNGYKRFKYSYATSPKAAFEEECRNYHDFGGKKELDNERHPRRPDDSGWKCPYCSVFL